MRLFIHFSLLILILLTNTGCSPDNKDKKNEGVLTDAQKKTLQKAKELDGVIIKSAEDQLKTADETN